jgi:hypothetical protein
MPFDADSVSAGSGIVVEQCHPVRTGVFNRQRLAASRGGGGWSGNRRIDRGRRRAGLVAHGAFRGGRWPERNVDRAVGLRLTGVVDRDRSVQTARIHIRKSSGKLIPSISSVLPAVRQPVLTASGGSYGGTGDTARHSR